LENVGAIKVRNNNNQIEAHSICFRMMCVCVFLTFGELYMYKIQKNFWISKNYWI